MMKHTKAIRKHTKVMMKHTKAVGDLEGLSPWPALGPWLLKSLVTVSDGHNPTPAFLHDYLRTRNCVYISM
jgi:hypothetical protein